MDLIKTISRFVIVMTVILIGGTFLFAGDSIRAAAPYVVWTLAGAFILSTLIATAMGLDFAWLFARNYHARKKTDHTLIVNEGAESDLSLERDRLHLAFESDALSAQAGQMSQGLVYATTLGDAAFGSHAAAVAKLIQNNNVANDGVPLLEPQRSPIMPVIKKLSRLLIQGASGAGKSTLIHWLEQEKINAGYRVLVIDTNATPRQWLGEMRGQGGNWPEVVMALKAVSQLVRGRVRERSATGKEDFPPVLNLIDEFTDVPPNVKMLGYNLRDDYTVPCLTQTRKVKVGIIWGVHSMTVKTLGLDGQGEIRNSFEAIIRIHVKHHEGQITDRWATIEWPGDSEKIKERERQQYLLPGPFAVQAKQAALQPELTQIATAEQPQQTILDLSVASESEQPDSVEKAVAETWHRTHNQSECYREYHELTHGEKFTGSVNGDKLKVIKAILATWGVDGF